MKGHARQVSSFPSLKVKRNVRGRLCQVSLDEEQVHQMQELIERRYRVHLYLDQLPLLMRSREYNSAIRGYPLGWYQKAPPFANDAQNEKQFFLFNHLKFIVTYTEYDEYGGLTKGIRITGFDVIPMSVIHGNETLTYNRSTLDDYDDPLSDKNPHHTPQAATPQPLEASSTVSFTYEVEWQASSLPWSYRWDVYVIAQSDDNDREFLAIVCALVIVVCLAAAMASVLLPILRQKETTKGVSIEEGVTETTTSRMAVAEDVFRPPATGYMALSVLVGSGCQIGSALALTLVAAVGGVLVNPTKDGHFLTALLVAYAMSGIVAGYVSSSVFKSPDEKKRNRNILLTATVVPGCLLTVYSLLTIMLRSVGAATAVTFIDLFVLCMLWISVSLPLVYLGAFFALNPLSIRKEYLGSLKVGRDLVKSLFPQSIRDSDLTASLLPDSSSASADESRESMTHNAETTHDADTDAPAMEGNDTQSNAIPDKTSLTSSSFPSYAHHAMISTAVASGCLVFAGAAAEISLVMRAFWFEQFYFGIANAFVIFVLSTTTVALLSIALTLRRLVCEDADTRWWWPSFWNGASTAGPLFLYSLWFLKYRLELIGGISISIYLILSAMTSLLLGLYCGSIGFLASHWIVRKLYRSWKKTDSEQ